jgi:ABC-2 type transport system permease protein
MRNRSSAAFVLLFPVLLTLVVGFVFMHGHPFEKRYVAIVSEGEGDAAIARSIEALAPFEEVRVGRERSLAEAVGKLRARMASAVVMRGEGERVRIVVGPRDQLFGRGLAGALPVQAELDVLEVPRWGYVHYLFPGLLTFSVMLSGLFGMGYPMALYRQNLFLKKLATTPLPRITFVAAQVAARTLLVLAQIALLVLAAWGGFGMHFSVASLAWLFLIATLGLFVFLGAGFALACAIENADLVVDVISAVNMPLVFLSEIFFPLEALPRLLEVVGGILPSTQMVRLIRAVLLYEVRDAGELFVGCGVLALWAAASFAVSLRAFKWHG